MGICVYVYMWEVGTFVTRGEAVGDEVGRVDMAVIQEGLSSATISNSYWG